MNPVECWDQLAMDVAALREVLAGVDLEGRKSSVSVPKVQITRLRELVERASRNAGVLRPLFDEMSRFSSMMDLVRNVRCAAANCQNFRTAGSSFCTSHRPAPKGKTEVKRG
jgi:hypothetical protein